MTPEQTAAVLAVVRMTWPQSNLGGAPETVRDFWHGFLGGLDYEHVVGALKEMAAQGREFAPPVGLLVKAATEREVDAPDFDEAWREADRVMRRCPCGVVPGPHAFSHPLIAAWARPAWAELRMGPAEGTSGYGTHYAQQREAYRAMRARGERSVALAAVGAPRRRDQLGRFQPLAGLRPPLRAIEGGAS